MKIALTHKLDMDVLKLQLQTDFKEYKISYPPLNKNTLRITKGIVKVILGQSKNNHLYCVGNINMLDKRIFIPFILGIALGFIPGILFLAIKTASKKKEFKVMEQEIIDYLDAKQLF